MDSVQIFSTPVDPTALDAKKPRFRFVDLFAGIGGFRLALEAEGGNCVGSVEWDRFSRQTYAANFDEPEHGDIRQVHDLPDHEVMAAGFPCQPFSIAGVSKNLSLGRHHGFRHKTQGTLFFDLARLVEVTRPTVLLFENVKNLTRHDHGRTFQVITETLDELDYEVTSKVIDARHWVPQHRERVFIVGFNRNALPGKKFVFPGDPKARPTLRKILDATVDDKYILSAHLWEYLQNYAAKHREAGNGFGYGLFTGRDVARTLSARYHKDGSEILIDTGGNRPRRLTPRECARLMGFPETFRIPVSDTQAYRQFGNAVSVPVVRHLAKAIVKQAGLKEGLAQRPTTQTSMISSLVRQHAAVVG